MPLGIVAMLTAAVAQCSPVAGADRLWVPATHWVLVGEVHGTNETPEAFTNLVCLAASTGRPVTVALEISTAFQQQIDIFINSDGGESDRSTLLQMRMWRTPMQDGRSSVAVLKMLDQLRQLKKAGRIVGVICSDAWRPAPAGPTRDEAMATAWTAIPTAKSGIVLALVGNVHAMRHAMIRPDKTIVTAGSLMPSAETITINVRPDGGKTWSCMSDGCGEHDSGVAHQNKPGITYAPDDSALWSATYDLGRATTAARPAITPDTKMLMGNAASTKVN